MLHQIIEIFEENRYLSLDRGFLVISSKGSLVGKVSLDDISVLLLTAQSITITKYLLSELAERNCIVITCGKNYSPIAIQTPLVSHFQQTAVIKAQIAASLPLKKNIWKEIIIEKLKNQAKVLCALGKIPESNEIKRISKTVLSGDSNNREAYAARLYWKFLFGIDFIRNKNHDGANALLNYGYTVVRSSITRAICSAGLLPSLGIFHDNNLNPACLADDLFEPFRPIVDLSVYCLINAGFEEVNPQVKKELVNILWIKLKTTEGNSPLTQAFYYYASSLVKCFKIKKPLIKIPIWEGALESISRTEQVRDYVDDDFI